MMNKKNYSFLLVLSGVNENTYGLEDALYEVGCDDALISYRNSVVCLDFDRESDSLQHAIESAISDIESISLGAKVNHIEGAFLTLSEIAEKTSYSKQAISLLIKGERGPGRFPVPFCGISSKSPLWRWEDVASWMLENEKITDGQILEDARLISYLNNRLQNHGDQQIIF